MTKNKILFVVAGYGYHPIEYIIPKKMLEKNGFIVEVASNKTGLAVAMDSSTSFINVLIKNIDVELYKGIFLIGGSGTMQHLDSKEMHLVLQKAFSNLYCCKNIGKGWYFKWQKSDRVGWRWFVKRDFCAKWSYTKQGGHSR